MKLNKKLYHHTKIGNGLVQQNDNTSRQKSPNYKTGWDDSRDYSSPAKDSELPHISQFFNENNTDQNTLFDADMGLDQGRNSMGREARGQSSLTWKTDSR